MPLAVVSALWRYPVKSMLGEACERLELDSRGARGDRVYAVCTTEGKLGSGKTTHRFSHIDGLFGYRAEDGHVVFPDGRRLAFDHPGMHEALSRVLGRPVTLTRAEKVSHHDSAPVHLVTRASLRWLRADERRFRPNIVVDLPGDEPVEQTWIGKTLAIGDTAVLRIIERTERCVMTTLAQADLPADPGLLKRIARAANLQFGVYAEVVQPGTIKCGDAVHE
ncbi:MAG TPA: MOSC domain-containing protein [Burkholderiales bacterium]|nr:MOSC domain-containing protein [Burkholderiales bacterium]